MFYNKKMNKPEGFQKAERRALLQAPYVGKMVIFRLEEIGYDSFAKLRKGEVEKITNSIAVKTGKPIWRNAPQAKRAVSNAIAVAKGLDTKK